MTDSTRRGNLRRALGASALLILVLTISAGMVTDWFIMPIYTRHGTEQPVPKLEGLPVGEARVMAEHQGFRLALEPAKIGGGVPEGTVLEQRPLPGAFAKPGRVIHVVPARSGNASEIPDLTGLDQRTAEIECRNLGMLVSSTGISYDFSAIVPKGGIVRQRPEPGAPVRGGEVVQLVISLGPRPDNLTVPSLIDLSLHEARQALLEAGLKLGEVTRKETGVYAAGTVIGQSLVTGTQVDQSASVDLIVAVPVRSPESPANTPNPNAD